MESACLLSGVVSRFLLQIPLRPNPSQPGGACARPRFGFIAHSRVVRPEPRVLSMQAADYLTNTPNKVPVAIPSLIDAAMAPLDADRNTPRGYIWRASALRCGKRAVRSGGESGRRSEFPSGLPAWQLNRVLDYTERRRADKTTAMGLAGSINVSLGHIFRTLKSKLPAKTLVGGSAPDTVGTRLYPVSVGGAPR
jgi:hypothetical protein